MICTALRHQYGHQYGHCGHAVLLFVDILIVSSYAQHSVASDAVLLSLIDVDVDVDVNVNVALFDVRGDQ